MRRLRDQTSSTDPVTARAAELLSAMPPLDTSRLRARTLPRSDRQRGAAARIRPGVAFALTLATVAAAAATLHAWPLPHAAGGLSGSLREATVSPASSPSSERGAGRIAPAAPAVDVPGNVVATVTGDVAGTVHRDGIVSPVAVESVGLPPTRAPAKAPIANARASMASNALASTALASNPQASSAQAPNAPTSIAAVSSAAVTKAPHESGTVEDESTLIVRAVRALRREADPVRAQTLAEEALQRFPHGAQVEEAMALVMESASARGDATGAQRAASAYLERFRSGRFADRAQRILASPAR